MTTRNPYSRLWATYVDKILLPDYWWHHGLAILDDRRKRDKSNVTGFSTGNMSCPDDISFTEFLMYSLRSADEHWRPISSLCNPCHFQPDFIAHVETFDKDRDFILQKARLAHLMTEMDHKSYAETEVRTAIDYTYRLRLRDNKTKDCLSVQELARKLWFSFQLKGYIRQNATFPETQIAVTDQKPHPQTEVAKVFLTHMNKDPLSAHEIHEQQEQAMLSAYRNIPQAVLNRIRTRYKADFLLFGYNATLKA